MYQYTMVAGDKVEGYNWLDGTGVIIMAKDEKSAIARVKKILKRKHYHIREIREIPEVCQESPTKYIKEMIKVMKKLVN